MIVVQFVDGTILPIYSADLTESENAALWVNVKSEGSLRERTARSDSVQIRAMKDDEANQVQSSLDIILSNVRMNKCA